MSDLDLGPIEGRRQAALATGDLVIALGIANQATTKAVLDSIARSAADVPALVDEVKRLRAAQDVTERSQS